MSYLHELKHSNNGNAYPAFPSSFHRIRGKKSKRMQNEDQLECFSQIKYEVIPFATAVADKKPANFICANVEM